MAPEELVRIVGQALESADFEPLLNALSDDIVWKSAATMKGFLRIGGQYTGRQGVEQWKSEFETDYAVRSITPKEVVVKEDVMWGLFWVDLLYRPTLAQVCFDCAVRWRLKNEKIVDHQAFIDTAAVLIHEQSGLLPR